MKKHTNGVGSDSLNVNRAARARVADKQNYHEPAFSMDENIVSLFQPDSAIAEQYFDNLRRKTILHPEKRLMLAILEDAIHSYQDNVSPQTDKAKRVFNAVEGWLFERDSDWIFSFETICEALNFDPRYVRQGLSRWKHQQFVKDAQPDDPEVIETPRYGALRGRK